MLPGMNCDRILASCNHGTNSKYGRLAGPRAFRRLVRSRRHFAGHGLGYCTGPQPRIGRVQFGAAADRRCLPDDRARIADPHRACHRSAGTGAWRWRKAGDALRILHDAHMRIAVVTNKHRRFASALLQRLNLMQWIGAVVGGDTCERRKPDPEPLLFACQSLGLSPSRVLMVGDSINDVTAARAAGIPIVCVPYGYNEGRDPRSLACDAMIETLADLPRLLWPEG